MRATSVLFFLLAGCAGADAEHVADDADAAVADQVVPSDAGGAADAGVPETPDAGGELDANVPAVPLFLDGFFPIAADYQQPESFERWRARGVNTMIRVPHRRGFDAWTAEANRLGLKMIREPRPTIEGDLDEAGLIAWSGQDEPDLHRVPASEIAEFRQRLFEADPDRPFFINFWGGAVLDRSDPYCNGPGDGSGEGCYPRYIESADWVGADIYPVNRYDGNLALIGRLVDKLERWAAPRPVMPYIEVSDWDGDGVGPSPRQVRAQMWHAIVHGARGLLYFAVRLRPDRSCCTSYDATPGDVADMMVRQHARITEIAPVLQGPIDPDAIGITLDAPLEATWRIGSDGAWFVVLNFSTASHDALPMRLTGVRPGAPIEVIGEERSITAAEDGSFTDDFTPYEVHIYRVP